MFMEDGSFRFIRFVLEESDQAEYFLREERKCLEFQEEFTTKLKALLRKKCADGDTKFLCDFVYLCTGQGYIPDVDTEMAKNFTITIEFNDSYSPDKECVPAFHTCTNTMRIPFFAYEGDIEKFEEKIVSAMKLCKGSFDMQ